MKKIFYIYDSLTCTMKKQNKMKTHIHTQNEQLFRATAVYLSLAYRRSYTEPLEVKV